MATHNEIMAYTDKLIRELRRSDYPGTWAEGTSHTEDDLVVAYESYVVRLLEDGTDPGDEKAFEAWCMEDMGIPNE